MQEALTGKKIFILYPDQNLRSILYGTLRNQFALYYMYDYEKVKPLIKYYPGSIVVINLIDNDLSWLPDEIEDELSDLSDDEKPSIVILYNNIKPEHKPGRKTIHFQGSADDLRAELDSCFSELGGKGRRNFVRYGGYGENIASLRIEAGGVSSAGIAHDISATGLSCSIAGDFHLEPGAGVKLIINTDKEPIELDAYKLLERNFNGERVHILKLAEKQTEMTTNKLLNFIYTSLDKEMEEFIKKLSN